MDSHRTGTVHFHAGEQLPFPLEPPPGFRIGYLLEQPDQFPVLLPAFHSDDALAAGRDHLLRGKRSDLELFHIQGQPLDTGHGQHNGIIFSPFQFVEPGGHIAPDIPENQFRQHPADFPDPPGTPGPHHGARFQFPFLQQHQGIPGIRL